MTDKMTQKKVLAVSNSGGHWVQMMRLRKAWASHNVTYFTTEKEYRDFVISDAKERGLAIPAFYSTVPASAWNKLNLIRQLLKVLWVIVYVRPDIIVSTGASIGVFAFKIGKLIGAKTIWVDSIANAENISRSGQIVQNNADIWLTQWEHLSKQGQSDKPAIDKPDYWGSVL